MDVFTPALATSVVPEPVFMAPAPLSEPKVTLSDALVENSSALVSPAASQTDVSEA